MHLWTVKREHKIQLKTLVRKNSTFLVFLELPGNQNILWSQTDFKHIRSRLTHERKVPKLHQKLGKRFLLVWIILQILKLFSFKVKKPRPRVRGMV